MAAVTVVALAAGWLLQVSWMRWMELLVDFGRELYIPWRLANGEHLGREIVHPYGPFSAYANAALFRVFGTSVQTLVLANLAVLGLTLALLFILLRRAFGFYPALTGAAVAYFVFGVAHYSATGNYSFPGPYSHEAIHGMPGLLLLVLLLSGGNPGRALNAVGAGFTFGLLCLTKTEYVLAGGLVVAAAGWHLRRQAGFGRWIFQFAGAATAVWLTAWLLLAGPTGATAALRTVFTAPLAPWLHRSYTTSAHVRHFLGLDEPTRNLLDILLAGTGVLLGAAVLGGAAWASTRLRSMAATVAFALVGSIGAVLLVRRFDVYHVGHALPTLLLLGTAQLAWQARQAGRRPGTFSVRYWTLLLLLVAAWGMMARMALLPRIVHYGFFQAMLAGSWVAAFLVAAWPRRFRASPAAATMVRTVCAVVVVTVTFYCVQTSLRHYRQKRQPIGQGADRVFGYPTYPGHQVWDQVRDFLTKNGTPGAGLLVLPEGISLNYLTRRPHPLRIMDALPATLPMNGRPVLEQLAATPPEWVVMATRDDTAELGFAEYGADERTGRPLLEWVEQHYELVQQAGDHPFRSGRYGLSIWRWRGAR